MLRLLIVCAVLIVPVAWFLVSAASEESQTLEASGEPVARPGTPSEAGSASPVRTVPFAVEPGARSAASERIDVLVIDPEGRPVAGAEVAYAHPAATPVSPLELVEDTFARGAGTTTNARGEATLPDGEFGWIAARASAGLALARRDAATASQTLRLVPPQGVRVLVEDSRGAPAAAASVIATFTPAGDAGGLVLGRVVTDATGQAVFQGLEAVIASTGWNPERISVQANVVGTTVRAPFRDGAKLVLPATTRLVIRRGDRGRPAIARILPAALDPTGTLLEQLRTGVPLPPCIAAVRFVGTEAVFPRVGTGTTVRVVIVDAESGAPLGRAESPVRGEETLVSVASDSVAALRGVIVNEEGSPCAGVALRVVSGDFPAATSSRGLVVTGAEGRVVIPVPDEVVRRGASGTLRLQTAEGSAEATLVAPTAVAGAWTFGTAVLRANPLAAAGRVVDERGRAVAGARVMVLAENEEGLAVTDRRGSFAVYVKADVAECRVQVFAPGHCAPDGRALAVREVLTGQDDVVFRLDRTGGLRGRLSLAGEAVRTLAVRAMPGDHRVAVETDGAFLMGEVPPGAFTVELLAGEAVVAAVEGVVVRSGAITEDPRLATLAPITALHSYEVCFVDERNEVVREVDAQWSIAGKPLFPGRRADGAFEFLAAADTVHLRAGAAGHGALDRDVRPGATRITLHRGPSIRLRMTPKVVERLAGKVVSVSLVPDGPERGLGATSEAGPVHRDHAWRLRVGAAGAYRITVVAFPAAPSGAREDGVVSFDAGVVRVVDATRPEVHTIETLARDRVRDGE